MLKSKAKWNFIEIKKQAFTPSSIMESLFHERGLFSKEEQQQFLQPKLSNLESPANFKEIIYAKDRVLAAIKNKEKIIVYGDYDADGITSTALLINVLRNLGAKCDYYIPNRFTEGYGLHTDVLEQFQKQSVSLVITVDNGIANCVEADYAKKLGLDLIITDHHEVQEEIPDAIAVIHPSLSPNYSFKHLAGVGVAFQFARYLLDEVPMHLLDLVAIGTIADLVPLIKENRILVAKGLEQLHESNNVGIKALKKLCNLDGQISARDVGFLIAPRLNAVGRLQSAHLAVELLLTDDEEIAQQIAEEIEELNIERKKIVSKIVDEAEQKVNEDDGFIILYDKDWHEGVLGIAASRLVKKFDRPVMMLTYKEDTDELKGSARSIPAFNLFENGMEIRHLFTSFGGHSQAAGMTFPFENLGKISNELNGQILSQLDEDDFKQLININGTISIDAMTEELVKQISQLAPFGMGNEEPIFHFKSKPSQIRQIGQAKNHLKLQFMENNHRIDAIGFGLGHLYYFISPQSEIEIVGKLQINEWNGNRTVQVLIEDVAINEWQLLDFRGRQSAANINPYLASFKSNVIVCNDREKVYQYVSDFNDITIISYNEDIEALPNTEILFIYDLPSELKSLEKIIYQTNPNFIHASYTITDHAYLHSIPNREDFKWLYAYLFNHCPIHLNVDLPSVMQIKRWTKDKIIFILKVFLDLRFITIQDNIIYLNKNAEKKPLQTSKTYQKRIEQGKVEKLLYYSTYEELKQWLENFIRMNGSTEEELLHEF